LPCGVEFKYSCSLLTNLRGPLDSNRIAPLIYPVRNNAPLLPPGQRPSGPAAAAGLDFKIIPAGFNAPLEFLTGFTPQGE
jgi:hypothetical protein